MYIYMSALPLALRTVILMWITVIAGGTFFMENPMNSLVACHPRYVWMAEQLLLFGIPVS